MIDLQVMPKYLLLDNISVTLYNDNLQSNNSVDEICYFRVKNNFFNKTMLNQISYVKTNMYNPENFIYDKLKIALYVKACSNYYKEIFPITIDKNMTQYQSIPKTIVLICITFTLNL